MGYGPKQIKELLETIDATPCDVVLSGTPIDLSRVLKTKKPVVHVRYELDEIGHPNLEDVLRDWEFIWASRANPSPRNLSRIEPTVVVQNRDDHANPEDEPVHRV